MDDVTHLLGAATLEERSGQLVLIGSKCADCHTETVPAVSNCPNCASANVTRTPQPQEGILYSMTTLHVGPRQWLRPMSLGYVDLPNGVRVLGVLHGEGHAIGNKVTLSHGQVGTDTDGTVLNNFVFVPMGKTE